MCIALVYEHLEAACGITKRGKRRIRARRIQHAGGVSVTFPGLARSDVGAVESPESVLKKGGALKLAIASVVVLAAIATAAHANTYTYMCRVGDKSYPVKVTTPNEANGSMRAGAPLHGAVRCSKT